MTRVATPLAAKVVSDRPPPPACDDDAIRALPSVEPLPPGTRPTEEGWFIVQWLSGDRYVVEAMIDRYDGSETIFFLVPGLESRFRARDVENDWTFIARIFPDRIGQE